jgi:hypothetical protein
MAVTGDAAQDGQKLLYLATQSSEHCSLARKEIGRATSGRVRPSVCKAPWEECTILGSPNVRGDLPARSTNVYRFFDGVMQFVLELIPATTARHSRKRSAQLLLLDPRFACSSTTRRPELLLSRPHWGYNRRRRTYFDKGLYFVVVQPCQVKWRASAAFSSVRKKARRGKGALAQ